MSGGLGTSGVLSRQDRTRAKNYNDLITGSSASCDKSQVREEEFENPPMSLIIS